MRIPQSKRLRITIAGLIANFVIGAFGIYFNADLAALGTFLALANSPLYVYILGDSFRPSQTNNI